MNLSGLAPLFNTAAELSLSEKGISSAKVCLTGFVVVFAVLILLIFIIKLYSAIVMKAQQHGKKSEEPAAEASAQPVQTVSEPVQAVSAASEGDELIAVISAAVAAQYGSSEKVRIKSIKKSDRSRSAWSNAGLLDNTRPF